MPYYVYILASGKYGTLYVGVTNDLIKRVVEHREGIASAFTRKYKVTQLVYYEVGEDAYEAIRREKQVKHWNRRWKINRIEEMNPEWRDLYEDLAANSPQPPED